MRQAFLTQIVCGCAATLAAEPQPVANLFLYDAVGNRAMITSMVRPHYAATSFSPAGGQHGQLVNIYGRNLVGATVTFNSVPATILNVAPTLLTVKVPDGASTGSLVVTLPGNVQFDLGTFFVRGLVITPKGGTLVVGQSLDFQATVMGIDDEHVVWDVLCPAGSEPDAECGSIASSGRYTPPTVADRRASPEAIIRASVSGLSVYARIRILGTVGDNRLLTVLAPAEGNPGVSLPNTSLSMPAITAILPAAAGPGFPANTAVALPPILSILFGSGQPGGSAPNTTVAQPPIEVQSEPTTAATDEREQEPEP